jgi:hypothetical protein
MERRMTSPLSRVMGASVGGRGDGSGVVDWGVQEARRIARRQKAVSGKRKAESGM